MPTASPPAVTRIRTLVAAMALASLGPFIAVPEAAAQGRGFGGPGISSRLMQPEYTRRDLPLFSDNLQLDTSQRVIIETLLLDYLSSYEAAAAVMQESLEQLRPEPTPEEEEERAREREERRAIFEEMRDVRNTLEQLRSDDAPPVSPTVIQRLEERLEALRQRSNERRNRGFDREEREARMEAQAALAKWLRGERDSLGRKFVTDVQLVLSEEQLETWPSFERLMRRMKTMRLGELSGERTDLFIVLRDAQVDTTAYAELPDLLEGYAYDLDRALVARNQHLDSAQDEMRQAMSDQDMKKAESIVSKESRLRVAVRGVNERYTDVIGSAITDVETAEAFRAEARRRSFPRVFRPTTMMRAFEAAREIEALDEEILASIVALEESYLLNLGSTNESLVRTIRSAEPERSVERIRRMAARFADGGGWGGRGRDRGEDEDPIIESYRQRDELDYRYWQQLTGLLMPEQVATLPEVKKPRERGERAGFVERFAEVDFDGNGKITRDEAPEWMGRFFDRIDSNGDGVLDTAEQEAVGQRFGSGGRGGRGGDGGGRGGRGGGRGGNGGGRGGNGT
jgi:hypothetical protein